MDILNKKIRIRLIVCKSLAPLRYTFRIVINGYFTIRNGKIKISMLSANVHVFIAGFTKIEAFTCSISGASVVLFRTDEIALHTEPN